MSLNKIILIFLLVLVVFGGVVYFQFLNANTPKSSVTIDGKTFSVFLAQKPLEQEKGLSGRASLPETQGMLFLFAEKGDHPFWMKDMKFPIDIIFINDNKIVSITQSAPPPEEPNANLPLYQSTGPANKVLEINAGLAKKYNFKTGDTITIVIKK